MKILCQVNYFYFKSQEKFLGLIDMALRDIDYWEGKLQRGFESGSLGNPSLSIDSRVQNFRVF